MKRMRKRKRKDDGEDNDEEEEENYKDERNTIELILKQADRFSLAGSGRAGVVV